jgi:hypothetical protein
LIAALFLFLQAALQPLELVQVALELEVRLLSADPDMLECAVAICLSLMWLLCQGRAPFVIILHRRELRAIPAGNLIEF